MIIDGKKYNAEFLRPLTLNNEILNGENSGRLQNTGSMYLEYIGTFPNYSGTIYRSQKCTDEEWIDLIFNVLSNPKNDHEIVVPYGNGYLTARFYISAVKSDLIIVNPSNNWSKKIQVKLTPINSVWLEGKSVVGYTEGKYGI